MEIIILLFSFAVSLFTRVIESGKFFTLTAEVGQHYLEAIKLLDGQILLQGPLTSHPWIRLSATPYYLFFPIFALFNYHPLTLTYLTMVISIITPIVNYFVVKKTFDKKTAVVSTILLSFSPLALTFSRVPGFYSLVPILIYWLLVLLKGILADKKKKIWPVFLVVGLMSTLHAASFMLFPLFLAVFYLLRRLNLKSLVYGLMAFVIPNIPFVINDSIKGFSMTKSLILWIPYKIFNFLSGKTLGLERVNAEDVTLKEVLAFMRADILPPQSHCILGIFVLLVIVAYFYTKKRPAFERVVYYWMLFGLLVLVVHKNPPYHYFVPIFSLPLILLSKAIMSFPRNKIQKFAVSLIIVVAIFINTKFVFSNAYLYNDPNKSHEFVGYSDQVRIARMIVNDAKGKEYSLTRIGPFDNYANEFKENYEFLLWREGNGPVKDAKTRYVIIEGDPDKTKTYKKLGQSGKVSLYRINNPQSK